MEFNKVYQLNIAAEDWARANAQDVLKLSVRNASGDMVPFVAFTTMEPSMGSANINRYNMYESASLTATPASAQNPGTSEAQPSANPADNQTNTHKVDK